MRVVEERRSDSDGSKVLELWDGACANTYGHPSLYPEVSVMESLVLPGGLPSGVCNKCNAF